MGKQDSSEKKMANFACGDLLYDYEKNQYQTVEIRGRCWMKENLRSTKDSKGRKVKYQCYSDSEENCEKYGNLYSYQAAFNGDEGEIIQGVCPSGWHIPAETEYENLLDNFSTEKCDLGRNDGMGICQIKEEFLSNDYFSSGFSGSCDLLCNYQNCSYSCSGMSCRSVMIFSEKLEEGFSIGKRIVVNNCEPVKNKVDVLIGGLDSTISIRCIKDE